MTEREIQIKQGRKCRVKSEVRQWLDKVVLSAIQVAARDHTKMNLDDRMMICLRKRIAGSISDGLESRLRRGLVFEVEQEQ